MEADSDSDSSVELVNCKKVWSSDAHFSDNDDTSSNSSTRSSTDQPILVAIESPNVSAIITTFNATDTLSSIFSNNGHNLVDDLPYEEEWFRKMPDAQSRAEYDEESWLLSVRKELQLINAFLSGSFKRRSASTGELESLFRMKVGRTEEPQFEVSTVFKILVELPEIRESIMQYVNIDSELVPVLPIPVEVDNYSGSLQGALDRVFWAQILESNTDTLEDPSQIPVLDKLCPILVVQCQQAGILIDQTIWPQRYTEQFRALLFKRWQAKKEQEEQIKELDKRFRLKSLFNGANVVDKLSVAVNSLSSSGHNTAANELSDQLSLLKKELEEIKGELSRLRAAHESTDSIQDFSELDSTAMTPYTLKALVWTELSVDHPIAVVRSWTEPADWIYTCDTEMYTLGWSDVVSLAKRTENFLLIYEHSGAKNGRELAGSIRSFFEKDDAALGSSQSS